MGENRGSAEGSIPAPAEGEEGLVWRAFEKGKTRSTGGQGRGLAPARKGDVEGSAERAVPRSAAACLSPGPSVEEGGVRGRPAGAAAERGAV